MGVGSEAVQVAVRDETIVSPGVAVACSSEHRLRDVNAHDVEPQPAQEPCRTASPATEVDGLPAVDVLADDRGQVPVGQVVRPGELEP
jgi:hypothetical protein